MTNAQLNTEIQEDATLVADHDETVTPVKTPSWFEGHYEKPDADELVARYRRRLEEMPPPPVKAATTDYETYRQRVAARVSEAQANLAQERDHNKTVRRPTMPAQAIADQNRYYAKKPAPTSTLRVAMLTLVAVSVGGGVGYGFANPDPFKALWENNFPRFTMATPLGKPDEDNAGKTTIQQKTVATATLAVEDVSGLLNDPIPLLLSAAAANDTAPISLRVIGLPEAAYLSAGVELAKGDWLLKPQDIPNVSVTIPASEVEKIELSVAAIETKTGELAAPVKEMTVALKDIALQVIPANAPPQTDSVIGVEVSPEARSMMEKGEMLLTSGDVLAARPFFLRAHELGLGLGALGVARTYDPKVFATLKVQGLKPDAAKAMEWYQKAASAGVVEAQTALNALPSPAMP